MSTGGEILFVPDEKDIEHAVSVLRYVSGNIPSVRSNIAYRKLRCTLFNTVNKLIGKDYAKTLASSRSCSNCTKRKRVRSETDDDLNLINSTRHRIKHNHSIQHLNQVYKTYMIEQSENSIDSPRVDRFQHQEGVIQTKMERNTSVGHDGTSIQTDSMFFQKRLHQARKCSLCKQRYTRVHQHYDQLCDTCATLNWEKRHATANMHGLYVLLTGGRVKIGFECGLKLLRAGATVICTSRFPVDANRRYSEQKDSRIWMSRLQCYGLDLRDIRSVEQFCDELAQTYPVLHVIINNAAQTIRRPSQYYAHLMSSELHLSTSSQEPMDQLEDKSCTTVTHVQHNSIVSSAWLSQLHVDESDSIFHNDTKTFPTGEYDENHQQIDLRSKNSWKLKLDEISTTELIEVFAINAIAPFVINRKLKSMLKRSTGNKYIINVSSMEGKFNRYKQCYHPHTNAAKAALNMMTRTSAHDYVRDCIFMTCVDTGWINDENSVPEMLRIAERYNFIPPLDEIDSAARILDPIFTGINTGRHYFGQFFKNYRRTDW